MKFKLTSVKCQSSVSPRDILAWKHQERLIIVVPLTSRTCRDASTNPTLPPFWGAGLLSFCWLPCIQAILSKPYLIYYLEFHVISITLRLKNLVVGNWQQLKQKKNVCCQEWGLRWERLLSQTSLPYGSIWSCPSQMIVSCILSTSWETFSSFAICSDFF